MFMDPLHAMPADDVRGFVASIGAAQFVTVGAEGKAMATQLAILWQGDAVLTHIARENAHASALVDGQDVLLIVQGAQAYIPPRSHGDHVAEGKVLPTWNYSTVQLRGRLIIRDDDAWLRQLLATTIDHHESARDLPWSLDDADQRHVERLLPLALGLEIQVTEVSAKAKLSQDKTALVRRSIAAALEHGSQSERLVAADMAASLDAGGPDVR